MESTGTVKRPLTNVRLAKLIKLLRRHKNSLFSKYPLCALAICGSVARGDATEQSDLDILVEFSGNIGLAFVDLAEELEYITQSKVDLLSRNGLKERYFQSIQPDLVYV